VGAQISWGPPIISAKPELTSQLKLRLLEPHKYWRGHTLPKVQPRCLEMEIVKSRKRPVGNNTAPPSAAAVSDTTLPHFQ
jgi:hypothetical protein